MKRILVNPVKKILIWLIKLYQKVLSPLKRRPCCRFYPTCSNYAITAFEEWGVIRGIGLSVWRILRCNPFCRGGIDNVPENPKRNSGNSSRVMTAGKIQYRAAKRVK